MLFTLILYVSLPLAIISIALLSVLSSLVTALVIIKAITIPIIIAIIASSIVVCAILLTTACVSDSPINPISVQPVTASFEVTICTDSPLIFSSKENVVSYLSSERFLIVFQHSSDVTLFWTLVFLSLSTRIFPSLLTSITYPVLRSPIFLT